jgi:two-component system, NarL family, sensor histidine kinase EvgS
MSHEIRTPMNAILGFTQLLNRKLEDPRMLSYLKSITASGNALLRLIDDILDISKIEAGKLDIQYSDININELFYSLDVMFGTMAREKGLNFIVLVDEDSHPILRIDELRIRQVITNLLSNAIKFTEHGRIELKAIVSYKANGLADLSISVTDTGCGIPEKDQDVIFDAFEQKPGQDQHVFGGTGLGLAICKSLIELMNGEIKCNSRENIGSTFTFTLRNLETAKVISNTDNDVMVTPNLSGCSILIAEDINHNRELLKNYLADTEVKLEYANDGLQAVEMVRSLKPDLILMDIKMPKMDGLQAASIIKNDPNLKNIPIVIISASAMKADQKEITINSDAFIAKPVMRHELFRVISNFKLTNISKPRKIPATKPSSNPHSLYSLLNGEVLELQKTALKTMQLSHLENFAGKLQKVSSSYDDLTLSCYVDQFNSYYKDYDMKGVESTLKDYPEFIGEISEN